MSVKSVGEILAEMEIMADCEEYQLIVQLMHEYAEQIPSLVDDDKHDEVKKIQRRRRVLASIRDEICRNFYAFKGLVYNG